MKDLPAEAIAWRRTLGMGCLGSLVGALAVGGLWGYFLLNVVAPREPGWVVVGESFRLVVYVVVWGMVGACGAMWLAQRWYYARGVYRCVRCGRPLRGESVPCECVAKAGGRSGRVRRRVRFRHERRWVWAVLGVYALMVPVTFGVLWFRPVRLGWTASDVVVLHFVLCALVGVVLRLVSEVMEPFGVARRFRIRVRVFLRVLAVWPLGGVAWMMVKELF